MELQLEEEEEEVQCPSDSLLKGQFRLGSRLDLITAPTASEEPALEFQLHWSVSKSAPWRLTDCCTAQSIQLHVVLLQEPACQLQKGVDPQQPTCFQEPAENSNIRYLSTAQRHSEAFEVVH